MGAWGYGSFDNDSAMDFIGDVININKLEKLIKLIHKKNSDLDYNEVRVAAEFVLHLHEINSLWFDRHIIDGLVDGLELAIADKEWFDSWRDERDAKSIIKQLKSFVKKLKALDAY